MSIVLTPPHEHLTFMTPMSEQRADALVRFLARDLHGTVLDLGCGWAELLLRVVAAAPGAHGVGIDLGADSVEHARHLAERRGLTDRTTLCCADAKDHAPDRADAVVCIGASQIWGPPAPYDQPLDYTSALAAIRAMVPRGGRVVYGEAGVVDPADPGCGGAAERAARRAREPA